MNEKLIVKRSPTSLAGTFGELYLYDNKGFHLVCYTLEPVRPLMDVGVYPLSITYSPKFKKPMPLIDVPNHAGVRIHYGNNVGDTEGCLLLGLYKDFKNLYISRPVVDMVISLIKLKSIKCIEYV